MARNLYSHDPCAGPTNEREAETFKWYYEDAKRVAGNCMHPRHRSVSRRSDRVSQLREMAIRAAVQSHHLELEARQAAVQQVVAHR